MNTQEKINILVVDDDPVQRMLVHACLAGSNYNIQEAANGKEALSLFEESSGAECPRIVLTDLNMPIMNGLELIKELRAHEVYYTYIIVLTTNEASESVVESLSCGADDFVQKPIKPEELELRLKSGLRLLRLENFQQMIFTLAKLSEYRSDETGFHLERVERYTRLLAKDLCGRYPELDISRKIAEEIAIVSPLHDIGKVAIADNILHKPGQLTEEEFIIMKTHAGIGGKLLLDAYNHNKTVYSKLAYEVAMYHHEKFDGSGYPDGLSGRDIPLSARIVALTDAYDAMTSKRCYKDAFPHEKVKDIIIQGRGTHFDPMIVDSFLANEDMFITIKDKYRD